MNAATGPDVWYLARDGKQHGPLSDVEMTKLVELGHLRAADLVWRPGFTDWRPAPSVFPAMPAEPAAQPGRTGTPAFGAQSAAGPTPVTTASAAPAAQSPAARTAGETVAAQVSPKPEAPSGSTSGIETSGSETGASARRSPGSVDTRAAKPMTGETRAFIPANQTSQFGTPFSAGEPLREPRPTEPQDEAPAGGQRRGLAVPLLLLVLIGGASTAGYMYRDTIKATVAGFRQTAPDGATAAAPTAQTETAATSSPATDATPLATAAVDPAGQPTAVAPVTGDASVIDAGLQKSPFWTLAKSEFPDWYADRVREVGQLTVENKTETEINAKLVDAVVALRRQNAEKALAASPARLQEIASAFITNLSALQSQSVDACYGFISKGEATPAAAALMQKPVEGAALHAQLQAVFAAVVEGRKSPAARTQPQKSDYDLLASELGTIGWSQADIQLFADPKALSEAPRERVCKMVRDWFSAHLAVKDAGARERLLFETLRPVVAG